jgi:cell growth-regulating nucleolar protein
MTEDQKYQGALYKEKTPKKKTVRMAPEPQVAKPESRESKTRQSYVEDADDDYESWDEYDGPTDDERSPAEPMPEAPTPPSALAEDSVNVFDYLIATGQTPGHTPNASKLNLPDTVKLQSNEPPSTSLVPYEHKPDDFLDPSSIMDYDDDEPLVQYGSGSIPADGTYTTPANKAERRRTKDSDTKKDKKRKRLHVEVPRDHMMVDATPGFHTGLTGGIDKLMRQGMPPSPDYSGSGNDATPASPLKKSKHSKHHKSGGHASNSLFGILAGSAKSKTKPRTKKSSSSSTQKKHSSRSRDEKPSKLIEFRPTSKGGSDSEGAANDASQMIVYKPRADVFLSFVNKGPESEKGCSMNKALKRFHRERKAAGTELTKGREEKELWRSLRLRKNERGEIVLFSEDVDLNEFLS